MDRMGVLGAAMESQSWGGELRDLGWADEEQESRLLAAMAAGNREAAERLVERTYRGGYGLLRRLGGAPDLAADLTHGTYPKAGAAPPRFPGQSRVPPAPPPTAYHACLNPR